MQGKPIFFAHGDETDTVVGPEFYTAAEAYLSDIAGGAGTVRRYSIRHAVAPEMVRDLAAWFATVRVTGRLRPS